MHDHARPMLLQQPAHHLRVTNVAAHKRVALVCFQRRKVRRISRVRQQVNIHHRPAAGFYPTQNEVRADKPRSAGHENRFIRMCHSSLQPNQSSCVRKARRPSGFSLVKATSHKRM
jgi:hypothetical protein